MTTSHAEIVEALLAARRRYGSVPTAQKWSKLGLRPPPQAICTFYRVQTFAEATAIVLTGYPQEVDT